MEAKERRMGILQRLQQSGEPLPASKLAAEFSVSRQIIVGDVALLRVGGEEIIATPRGYVLAGGDKGLKKTLACSHSPEDMERELSLIVDSGCTVEDVIVEHPVYGQLTGRLSISSRYDIRQFMERVQANEAKPLSDLTNGIHLHTLTCPDEAHYRMALEALRQGGFLVDETI
ncbi:MAG: transcription repressor NadR [Oscillospiraceae bacterium]|nr:transcription repressor NadR [Oscillospiraceae bacterium]